MNKPIVVPERHIPVRVGKCPAGCCYLVTVASTTIHMTAAEFASLGRQVGALLMEAETRAEAERAGRVVPTRVH